MIKNWLFHYGIPIFIPPISEILSRLISIFVLFAFIFPFFGTYALLHHHVRVVRREVKRRASNGFDKEDLTHFEFTSSEAKTALVWQHEDEFEYNGRMYDVVSKEERNGKLHFWCLDDHKESQLKEQLNDIVKSALGTSSPETSSQLHFFRFFCSLYYSGDSQTSLNAFASIHNSFAYKAGQFYYSSPPPLTPPPQLV